MSHSLFATSASWLLAVAPLVVLAAVAMLGQALGEAGRDWALAYAAVLLALVSGVIGAGAAGSGVVHSAVPIVGFVAAFASLILGGSFGLGIVTLAFGGAAALSLTRGDVDLPWPLPLVAAVACAVVAARYFRI